MPSEPSARIRFNNVTAAVLAGGRSARFGSDKALAKLGGGAITFLERTVSVARSVAEQVLIVAPDRPGYQTTGASLVSDLFPGEGPAGGVLTALRAATTEWLLVLSCDQPFVEAPDLEVLLACAESLPGIAFQSAAGRIHPMPCLIRVESCRPIADTAFAEGCRSLVQLLSRCRVQTVPVGSDDVERRLRDIDSPADLFDTGLP